MIDKKQIIYKIRKYINNNKKDKLFEFVEKIIIEIKLMHEIALEFSGPEIDFYESDKVSRDYINKKSMQFLNILIGYKNPKDAYKIAYRKKLIFDCEIDDIIKEGKVKK